MADINYIYNDPTTPALIGPYNLPPKPGVMDFKVDGFRGATPAMYTLEHQAACAYVTVVNSINLANRYLAQPLTRWATANILFVQPRAGKQLNAYYDRQALRFFYAMDPTRKALVYTVNSTDVVSHETGHAILDAIRPDLFNVQALEVWAFHESFGDIHAIMNMLHQDFVVDFLLNETGGYLRKENSVTKLAEEMGTAIYNMTGGRIGNQVGVLRNAFNNFKYVEPEKLPRGGLDNQLTAEPHNFSRVFTGAWYDILVAMFENLKTTLPAREALVAARDTLSRYTYQSLRMAANTVRFYDAVARAMLIVDKANNYAFNGIMNQAFIARGILREAIRPMVAMDWLAFQSMVEPADEVMEDPAVVAVRNKNVQLLTLPTYLLNVEAPGDTYYEFNGTGECVNIITTSAEEVIEHAHQCVDFLTEKGLIRSDKQTPFEIDEESNLVRSHFACFNDNCKNPQAPEYGKCWKPENNAGCGCNSRSGTIQQQQTSTQTVVVQRNVRN
jgi:hypothetical protein